MPIHIAAEEEDFELVVWRMDDDETETDLYVRLLAYAPTADLSEYETLTHPRRRREWLASRYLLYRWNAEGIWRDEYRKLHFLGETDWHLSVSHTDGFVAVARCKVPCGIDIQVPNDKAVTLAHRYLTDSELKLLLALPESHHLGWMTFFWCAKEAVFKAYGKGQLPGKTIQVQESPVTTEFVALIQKSTETYHYGLRWLHNQADFMLVVALEQLNIQSN